MIENLGKVILAVTIQMCVFIGLMTIISFSSQLCVQLGFNKLGLYILLTNSISSLIMTLFGPILLMKYNAKNIIVLASFGMT